MKSSGERLTRTERDVGVNVRLPSVYGLNVLCTDQLLVGAGKKLELTLPYVVCNASMTGFSAKSFMTSVEVY
jgi:hypothetical protein